MDGILNVWKEAGWTSHDVVARVRRLSGQRRVGHAGTLDPMAEGVLPVVLGRATRLADIVGSGKKRYLATIRMGESTDTDDAEGVIIATEPVPNLTHVEVESALMLFRGPLLQTPPAYSAVKVAGQRSYVAARRGQTLALQPREVEVYRLELLGWDGQEIQLDITCSRGFYVRALARDLARSLDTHGHLCRLVRTEVGALARDTAHRLQEVEVQGVPALLLPPDAALADTPEVRLEPHALDALRNGRPLPADGLKADLLRVYDLEGQLWFVGQADGITLRPRISFAPEAMTDPVAGDEPS